MESTEELRDNLLSLRRENARLQTENSRSRLLIDAVEQLLAVESGDPFDSIFPALRKAFNFSSFVVLTERPGRSGLVCSVAEPAHLLDSEWKKSRFLERVLAGRVSTMINNERLQDWTDLPASILSPTQPALYIPLKVNERRSVMILFRNAGEDSFDRDHVDLAREFALLASLALAAKTHQQNEVERERLEQLTERLRASEILLTRRANYDPLTGLPNREFAEELIERAITNSRDDDKLVLVFIDVDDFKKVNDNFGHGVGDEFLCQFAKRLRHGIRDIDLVSRISGDEFVVVFRETTLEQVFPRIERLRQALAQAFVIGEVELWSSATFGVARFPRNGRSYAELHRAADIAMYHGKADDKGSICLYTRKMGDHASRRARLEQELRSSIAERRFLCAFQPKVDLDTHEVVGFEALARWQRDDGTLRTPDLFIEQASSLNLLDEITEIVLDDLLAHAPELDRAYGSHMRYSINISAKQIGRIGFVRNLIDRCDERLEDGRLMFEVTEDAFVDPQPLTHSILPLLSASGIGLSIDDFGTGYSSLSTLTNLPADELKVDRSFITRIHEHPRNQSVLKAIESLAGTLGMELVAEGVELHEEREYLKANTRIGVGQGFLFAQPQLPADIIASRGSIGSHSPRLVAAKPGTNILPEANPRDRRLASGNRK